MFILCIFSGAIFTSKLGAKMNTKIDFKVKKNLLAALLIIFGIKTVLWEKEEIPKNLPF